MGQDKTRVKENSSIWRRDYNNAYSCHCPNQAYRIAIISQNTRKSKKPSVAGLDLSAGKGENSIAILEEDTIQIYTSKDIYKITSLIKEYPINIVSIDAPLCTPYRGFRKVERALMKCTGTGLLPGGLKGMHKLTKIGNSLCWQLYEAGVIALETHPGTIKRVCRIYPEKTIMLRGDELDAFLALLNSLAFTNNASLTLMEDAPITLPSCTIIRMLLGRLKLYKLIIENI
ncbi:MAG: hypothetical protein GSR72_05700 [Desulfurococcales archaeon]|nr:hypothetical protein [Desulfurococcales archaeon]